jgi:hypothetical protein
VYPQASTYAESAIAYEAQRDWNNSVQQWKKLLDARGEILQEEFPADLVLAHLHMARAYDRVGDGLSARQHYEAFLHLWQQSDDLIQRREAISELQSLILKSEKGTTAHQTN